MQPKEEETWEQETESNHWHAAFQHEARRGATWAYQSPSTITWRVSTLCTMTHLLILLLTVPWAQESPGHGLQHILIKFQNVTCEEKNLRASREKNTNPLKGSGIKMALEILTATTEARKHWMQFPCFEEFHFRTLYSAKITIARSLK